MSERLRHADGIYVVAVVADLAHTRACYESRLDPATFDPEPTTTERASTDSFGLQHTQDAARAGKSVVVIGATDLDAQLDECAVLGITTGQVQDFGFSRPTVAEQVERNQQQLVEEVAE